LVVNVTPLPLYPRKSDPVPFVHEAECAPGPVWTFSENLVLIAVRSPDRPGRSNRSTGRAIPVSRTENILREQNWQNVRQTWCESRWSDEVILTLTIRLCFHGGLCGEMRVPSVEARPVLPPCRPSHNISDQTVCLSFKKISKRVLNKKMSRDRESLDSRLSDNNTLLKSVNYFLHVLSTVMDRFK
jgi:hypothetical protein